MAMAIAEQVEEKKGMREAMMFLQNYGITLNLAAKIYQEYGPKLYSIIKEIPISWQMIFQVWDLKWQTRSLKK